MDSQLINLIKSIKFGDHIIYAYDDDMLIVIKNLGHKSCWTKDRQYDLSSSQIRYLKPAMVEHIIYLLTTRLYVHMDRDMYRHALPIKFPSMLYHNDKALILYC